MADSDTANAARDVADPRARGEPENSSTKQPWGALVLVSLIGVFGFVALLVSSTYIATLANPLRIAALVWFFVFGALRVAYLRRAR